MANKQTCPHTSLPGSLGGLSLTFEAGERLFVSWN
jgi:hypothetical protein